MLRVWGRQSSLNVQKVLWLLGELRLEYEHVPAGGPFGRLDEPAFRALNPHARVPVLEDNEIAVWESHTILRYLAAKYGRGRFWNEDPALRARIEGWMDWSQSALQRDFLDGVFWGFFRTPPAQRDTQAVEKSIRRCAEHFRLLDGILDKSQFIVGDEFSLADIPIGTTLYRYYTLDVERPAVPNIERWYRRLQDRPAYREQVMIPFEELRGRLEY